MIAGNWKMNLLLKEALSLAQMIKEGAGGAPGDVVLCVPAVWLLAVGEILKGSGVRLGAQNLFWEKEGAFTGETSGPQLVGAGCRHVIIGHSERRRIFGETNEAVRKKLKAALECGLDAILCVGETLEERESQKTWNVVKKQIEEALSGFAPAALAPMVVAYEPVWAIGTGKTATPAQAQEVHLFIRKTVADLYGGGFASGLRILYGGSVKAENIDALMSQPDIDGALVGGESLKPVSFLRIVHFKVSAGAR